MQSEKTAVLGTSRAPARAGRSADEIREALLSEAVLGLRQAAANVGHTKAEAYRMAHSCMVFGGNVDVGVTVSHLKKVIKKADEDGKAVDEVATEAAAKLVRYLFLEGHAKDAARVARYLGVEDRLTEEKGKALQLADEVGSTGIATFLRNSEIMIMLPDSEGERELRLVDRSNGHASSVALRE